MKDNYKLIKNAIEAEKYRFNKISRDEKRKQLNIQNKFVVGHVGTFTSPKNHTFLLDIFKEVHNNNENAILLLVGDGELRSSIEKKIQDLHLSDSVILTGVRSDIPELLQAMDIFVFPSLFEGLPVTIIEAQASGLSCIVADTITKEVQISNFIKFISLAETTNYWSDEIQNTVFKVIREDQYKLVKENGYDINSVAALLKDFYLSNWN